MLDQDISLSMKDLGLITIERIQIELGRLKERIQTDSREMHNTHSQKGLLRSGATIKAQIRISQDAFFELRDICIKHLRVMADEAFFLNEASVSNVKSSISEMFSELNDLTFETMTKSCELSSKPELRERCMPEVDNESASTLSEVNLFIDERIISRRNRGIKGVIGSLFSAVKKLFTSGTG